jgi:hypothetical protein
MNDSIMVLTTGDIVDKQYFDGKPSGNHVVVSKRVLW